MSSGRLFRNGSERRRFLAHMILGGIATVGLLGMVCLRALETLFADQYSHRFYAMLSPFAQLDDPPVVWNSRLFHIAVMLAVVSVWMLFGLLWQSLFSERRRRFAAALPMQPGESVGMALRGARGPLVLLTPLVAGAFLLCRSGGTLQQLFAYSVFSVLLVPTWFAIMLLFFAAARDIVDRIERMHALLLVQVLFALLLLGASRALPTVTFNVLVLFGWDWWPDPLLPWRHPPVGAPVVTPMLTLCAGAVALRGVVRRRFEDPRFLMCPPRSRPRLDAPMSARLPGGRSARSSIEGWRRLGVSDVLVALHLGVPSARHLAPAVGAVLLILGTAWLATKSVGGTQLGDDLQQMTVCIFGPLWVLVPCVALLARRSRLLDLLWPVDLRRLARIDRWSMLIVGLLANAAGSALAFSIVPVESEWELSLSWGFAAICVILTLRTVSTTLPNSESRSPWEVTSYLAQWLSRILIAVAVVLFFLCEAVELHLLEGPLWRDGALIVVAYALAVGVFEDRRIRSHSYALTTRLDSTRFEVRGQDFGPSNFGRNPSTATGLTVS